MEWRHRAACRDEDPELFFPDKESELLKFWEKQAKAVCRRCDVSNDCLVWALRTGQHFGVWGGMTEKERRKYLRRHGERVR